MIITFTSPFSSEVSIPSIVVTDPKLSMANASDEPPDSFSILFKSSTSIFSILSKSNSFAISVTRAELTCALATSSSGGKV